MIVKILKTFVEEVIYIMSEDEYSDSSSDEEETRDGEKTEDEESSIPPLNVCRFGHVTMDQEYREALYRDHPYYTAEEIVGTFLGHNPHYPSEQEED